MQKQEPFGILNKNKVTVSAVWLQLTRHTVINQACGSSQSWHFLKENNENTQCLLVQSTSFQKELGMYKKLFFPDKNVINKIVTCYYIAKPTMVKSSGNKVEYWTWK